MSNSIKIPIIECQQPIGSFYLGVITAKDLLEISYSDVRRLEVETGEVDKYLGIQRQLSKSRVKEIGKYSNTSDACFPTAVILAIEPDCVEITNEGRTMIVKEYSDTDNPEKSIAFKEIAKILDGQHRLAGLEQCANKSDFSINVSIFVGADISDQASIFSVVNLHQSKVNKSLAYDLYDLAKARSPQKVCHNIVVALNDADNSPFFHKIKRLGTATPGRDEETLSQATIVNFLLSLISKDPMADRSLILENKKLERLESPLNGKTIFRNMFINGKDMEMVSIIWNFFKAVEDKWGDDWTMPQEGIVLNRTTGFRALMRLLVKILKDLGKEDYSPSVAEFKKYLKRINLTGTDINSNNYLPGGSGESTLYRDFENQVFGK